jgi:hypothetical protein
VVGRIGLLLVMSVLVASLSLAPLAKAATVQVPVTIDRTGTLDVTRDLQAFVDGVPDGSTIEFPAGGRYRIDGGLRFENRNRLVIDGNGSELLASTPGDRNRRHLWFIGGSDLVVREVVVRGANPVAGTGEAAYQAEREAQHAFDVSGVSGMLLERVEAYDVWGDFVYIGTGVGRWSRRVLVRDSTFERNGRQGISITGGEEIVIERNRIAEVRRSAFDLEPNGPGWGVRDVRIVGNRIGRTRLHFLAGHGAAAPFDQVVVERNDLIGVALSIDLEAPGASRRGAVRIIGNVSDINFGSSAPPIKISGYDSVVVRDNRMPIDARRGLVGIRVRSSCRVDVGGNRFPGSVAEADLDGHVCEAVRTGPVGGGVAPRPGTPASTPPSSTASTTIPTASEEPPKEPVITTPATGASTPSTGPEAAALPPRPEAPGDRPARDGRGGPIAAALLALVVTGTWVLRVAIRALGPSRSSHPL